MRRFLNSFTHIFSGGYAAGYYGYKWAQVMSLDGFAAFEEIGLNSTGAITDEGLRYRNTILADGGGRAPLLVFEVRPACKYQNPSNFCISQI
jgi:oligopeptidase A